MYDFLITNASIILPDQILEQSFVAITNGRIQNLGPVGTLDPQQAKKVADINGSFLLPGFIDLHVHGGAGADFMDATPQAYETVGRAHLKHGTTAFLPTTTVARHDQHLAFLSVCENYQDFTPGLPRNLGVHFYGPYFAEAAKGCHPGDSVRPPQSTEYLQYLDHSGAIRRATIAPELPGAEEFVQACRDRGIDCNVGHSHATFDQMEAALNWGVTHVDHLFCAMSDRARLRQTQTFPMRGGVMEATLFFDQLTTEVIADGKHLTRELLLLAHKIKGPDKLALVTDCNRALDMPDGEYIFGPSDGGEMIFRKDDVGVMPDGKSLASGVVGMDTCIRTFHQLTAIPLPQVVRMASLTPATIAGRAEDLGSIEVGKFADMVVMDKGLNVLQVFLAGEEVRITEGNQ
ncbi:MAG: N-acetylglucosamine-6-phosphate deacetylase [Gemmataceae bacterium]